MAMEWFRLRTLRSTWLITGLALASSIGLALAVVLVEEGRPTVISPGRC